MVKLTSCWTSKASLNMDDKHVLEDDLDAVLENINLLIGDMESSLSSSSVETLITTIPPVDDISTEDNISTNDEQTLSNNQESGEYISLITSDQNDNMDTLIPSIHHDFSSDVSVNSIGSCSSTQNNNLKVVRDTISKLQNHRANRNSLEMFKPLHTRFIQEESKRLYNSASNSPELRRKSIIKTSQLSSQNQVHFRDRTNSITPRLSMPNIEKFDIEVLCPDGNWFKAGVFKAWTAFQLAWKIAHVRGMTEKLALVVKEFIVDLHLSRTIEDHEIVHTVMENWAPDSNNKLHLEENINKYDLFNEPSAYLPIEILDLENAPSNPPTSTKTASRRSSLLKSIMTADRAPDLHGWVYIKGFDEKTWEKVFLRLRNGSLYKCHNEEDLDGELLYVCENAFLYDCQPEFMKAHGAPDSHCFCIIPEVVTDWSQIKCLCAESQRLLIGWTSGIRLAKYGQQLYMNFREAMSKEANLRRTNSARQSILLRRSYHADTMNIDTRDNKAALDFSGNSGRLISDPVEARKIQNEIAFEIPKTAKRRSGGAFSPAVVRKTLLENKVWYHGKLNREQAVQKLQKHGLKDGLFLVRDSSSSHGNLVLTVINKKGKINHHQIFQSYTTSGVSLYGVESGPQFSTLELLIESYHSGAVDGADFHLRKPCPL